MFRKGVAQTRQSSGNNKLLSRPGNARTAATTELATDTWVEMLGKTHPR